MRQVYPTLLLLLFILKQNSLYLLITKKSAKMFDMGMGMGMRDMGMRDIGMGVMDIGMGRGLQGVDRMAVGAMDIRMGDRMMDRGMMDMGMGLGAGMGMGMGAGMGMGMMEVARMDMGMIGGMDMGMGMGMGLMEADIMMGGLGMRGIGYCQPGCMLPCCMPMAGMGMTQNAQNTYVINSPIVQNQPIPVAQYQNQQQGYVQPNPIQQQTNMQWYQPQLKTNLQQQDKIYQIQRAEQQQKLQRQKLQLLRQDQVQRQQIRKLEEQKLAARQNLPEGQRLRNDQSPPDKQSLMNQQQRLLLQERLLKQGRISQQKRLLQQRMLLEKVKVQQRTVQLKNQQAKRQFIQRTQQQRSIFDGKVNPYGDAMIAKQQFTEQLLYMGRVHQQVGSNWLPVEAKLTFQMFANIKIAEITKIKIKAQSRIPETRLIKITTHHQDVFFSVMAPDQLEWMSRIIWAKMASLGKICNITDIYDGHVDGQIVKKGFFGGWEAKYGSISGNVFKISAGPGAQPQKTVSAVPQIWTRFQFVHGNMLVIKMHHSGFKLEIGVPSQRTMSWLRGLFYTIRLL